MAGDAMETTLPDQDSQSLQVQNTANTPRAQPSLTSSARRPNNRQHPSRAGPSTRRPTQRRPLYSLAGGPSLHPHGPSYVDPDYHTYHPRYRNAQNSPVWGLAKPLPRVVRPGMRRGRREETIDEAVEDEGAAIQPPGSAEAIPMTGMIDDQRGEVGKERIGEQKNGKTREERGFGHQGERRPRLPDAEVVSLNSVVDAHSSPTSERGNPMDDLGLQGELGQRSAGNKQIARRTSGLTRARASSVVDSCRNNARDQQVDPWENDLEAGESDDMSLDDDEAEQYMREENDNHNTWAEIRAKFREPLAECLASMIAVLIGVCTNLSVQTSNNESGSYQSTNWAWGLGITIGIYVAGGISGGHLNPAISLMLCLFRGFPVRKAMIYIVAQVFGCFLAGLIAYGVYRDAILAFDATGGMIGVDGGSKSAVDLFIGGSGKSFYTQPASFAGAGAAFANEFVATAILGCAILALGDDSNAPPGAGMHALIVGLVVTVLTMAFGYNTGACLNPARDLGPRLATAVVGYGRQVFTVSDAWWIYGAWGATVSGGLMGGILYDVAIFVGAESPVNYPRGKRRKMKREVKDGARKKWWSFRKGVESVQKDI